MQNFKGFLKSAYWQEITDLAAHIIGVMTESMISSRDKEQIYETSIKIRAIKEFLNIIKHKAKEEENA